MQKLFSNIFGLKPSIDCGWCELTGSHFGMFNKNQGKWFETLKNWVDTKGSSDTHI